MTGPTPGLPVTRWSGCAYPRRMGQAFVQLLEALDPTRLPIHGGDATTLVVTIDLDALKAELATADLIGAGLVPGDDLTGDRITAAQARRLACTAKILPVVLGGDSLPLDLGRTRRLFTPAQRKALLIRDRTCRAEGCDVPGTWCEAHHLHPWHTGGPDRPRPTAILLCSHHHHRAHEPPTASNASPTATTASTDADRTRRRQMLRAGRTFRPLWAPSSPPIGARWRRKSRHRERHCAFVTFWQLAIDANDPPDWLGSGHGAGLNPFRRSTRSRRGTRTIADAGERRSL